MHAVHAAGQRQTPRRRKLGGDAQDRLLRALAGGAKRGRAGGRVGYDGGGADGVRHLVGRRRNRIRRSRHGRTPLGRQDAPVRRVALDPVDYPAHDLDRRHRIGAGRGFRRQHHRVGAVIDRRRHIGDLGACGRGRMHHRLQHLGRHDHRLAGVAAGAHDRLLRDRHFLRRHFDAEVAPRHHHGVGRGGDLLDAVERGRLLDLDQDMRAVADQPARFRHVLRALHEGERDPLDAEPEREAQVRAVLVRQRRDRQHDARQVDALAVAQPPAVDHLRLQRGIGPGEHLQPEPPVVEEDVVARADGGEDLRMRHRGAGGAAGPVRAVQHETPARLQLDAPALEGADAQLGALHVRHDAYRAERMALQLAQDAVPPCVVLGPAMAEVEAEDIDARLEQPVDGLRARSRRSERRDDLGPSLAAHRVLPVTVRSG